MNREIKFRGKRVDNGKWVYGYYFHNGKFDCIKSGIVTFGVEKDSVGQYTGLKDSKRTNELPDGQPIFEGDIVNWKDMCVADYLWHKDDLIKVVDDIEVCYGGGQEWLLSCTSECEVIGNIYENKDLLEASK